MAKASTERKLRHFLSISDITREEFDYILDLASELKRKAKLRIYQPLLYQYVLA